MSHRPLPRDRRLLQRTGATGCKGLPTAMVRLECGGWKLAAQPQGAAQQQAVGAQQRRPTAAQRG